MPPAKQLEPGQPAEPTYSPQTRLAVVYFKESVTFGNEMTSAAVPIKRPDGTLQRGSNSVDAIELGWLNAKGEAFTLDGKEAAYPADGLVLRSKVHDAHSGKRLIRQVFVPWSNVKSIGYAE